MEFWGVAVVFISLALLIFLALRGFSIIIIAPIASLVVIFLTQMPVLETMQENYMTGFVNFAKNFYLIFLFAAMFGKFMEDSGAARSIAEGILKVIGRGSKFNVLIAIVVICALLTYGGINVFVVIFAILPIAKPLFKELDIPWHLFMAAYFFGVATFTMTMLPGTPAIQNVIPIKYFGTDVMAAPLLGIVAAITVIAFNVLYLKRALKKSEAKGETYLSMKNLENSDTEIKDQYEGKKLPHFFLSMVPPAFLLITLNVFKMEVLYTLMLSVLVCLVVFWPYIDKKIQTINVGAKNTVLPIVNTSADVGYGAVIAATAGFAVISGWLADIPGSPLISLYLATTFLAGITGSASGGLGIAMETLSSTYINLGLDPEVLHRVAAIASGGFDALPHNGAVITALAVAGLTHKDAYKHIFITCVIGPVVAAVPALLIGIFFY
ncbi:H+/gluconate symporter-like permease [Bacillus ectoiniformans]|uniref:GntP family permease n=1 Tax=Bacillus ectoiniformans TaxID=1494429 RepID=UPI00195CE5C6|nr:GntP family permease [Bacillus ectoiniformans]MBM7648689.1 H+/gluconate symporter-like permease [Bacillus ectoiniformans]